MCGDLHRWWRCHTAHTDGHKVLDPAYVHRVAVSWMVEKGTTGLIWSRELGDAAARNWSSGVTRAPSGGDNARGAPEHHAANRATMTTEVLTPR